MLARIWSTSVLDGDLPKNRLYHSLVNTFLPPILYHTAVKKNEINTYVVIQNNVLDIFGRTK